jgi:hypothetical protein
MINLVYGLSPPSPISPRLRGTPVGFRYTQGETEHVCSETNKPYTPKSGDSGDTGDSRAPELLRTSEDLVGMPRVKEMEYDRESSFL